MLTLTDNATTAVKALADQTAGSADAGIRISTTAEDTTRFAIAVTGAPDAGDAVIEDAGARVFLEENAAVALSDKVLDAEVDGEGSVRFALAQA